MKLVLDIIEILRKKKLLSLLKVVLLSNLVVTHNQLDLQLCIDRKFISKMHSISRRSAEVLIV